MSNKKDWGALKAGRAAVEESVGFALVNDMPLHVAASAKVCTTAAGQLALLTFLGMVARVHRPITLELTGGDADVQVIPLHGDPAAASIGEAAIGLIHTVSPTCSVWHSSRPEPSSITVGFGNVKRSCQWYVAVERAVAMVSSVRSSASSWLHPGSKWGAALGACLAANAVFRTAHGLGTPNVRLSAWNWSEDSEAHLGPDECFPVVGGSKLLVGAGSVAGALVHWLHYLGVAGDWAIVDGDSISEGNLIKGLNLAPSDVGQRKATLLSGMVPGARAEFAWYGESLIAGEQHDLVLCLANEFDVRAAISLRDPVLVLHATTGEGWDVHLHRHIRNRDDCLACRTRDWKQARMQCSTAPVPTTDGDRADTALPFAAGLAGLMLASALARLEAGELEKGGFNHWAIYLASQARFTQHNIRRCSKHCPRQAGGPLLPGRWLHLDPRVSALSIGDMFDGALE